MQDLLAANRQGDRKRTNAASPSLLAGLVFDGDGKPITCQHATKGTRRYRYYVAAGEAQARRWPAVELEQVVVDSLVRLLKDELELQRCCGDDAAALKRAVASAHQLAERIEAGSSSQRIAELQAVVHRIVVSDRSVQAALKPEALQLPSGTSVSFEVPVELKRGGMAVKLIALAPGVTRREPDPRLIALITRAQDWFARLATGQQRSVQAIADADGVSRSYVTRVIYLAFLAPDIVAAIGRGEQPVGLSADRLSHMTPLPIEWEAQRTLLGF